MWKAAHIQGCLTRKDSRQVEIKEAILRHQRHPLGAELGSIWVESGGTGCIELEKIHEMI